MQIASIENYIKVHGAKYDYTDTIISSKERKVLVTCKKHNLSFSIDKINHGRGYGCPVCNNKVTNTEQFKIKASEVHKDFYDYTESIYTKSNKYIDITCPVHGKFKQTANSHLSGHGCKECGIESSATKKLIPQNIFLERATEIHGDKYDYSKVVYTKIKDPIQIICPKHGEFTQIAEVHTSNQFSGCPSCTKYGFKIDKPAILYYLEVVSNGVSFYKIGITNRTVHKRYKSKDRLKIKTLFTVRYELGSDAYAEEQRLLKKYSSSLYCGTDKILSDGNTELFTSNVLSCYIT